jgi:3-hydroxyisobutyrate dehydrogenase-like beta-hydroxyacid dehydrogenase
MVVFTSLANDPAVSEVYDKLIKEATWDGRGKVIFVDQSTVHPDTASKPSRPS